MKSLTLLCKVHSGRAGGNGLAAPSFSHGKNKIPFCKKQVINKSVSVIFGLVGLIILNHNR